MTPDSSRREPEGGDHLERLYQEALDLPAGEREAFLDEGCGDDLELRAELASLLAHAGGARTFMEDVGRFVESPGGGPPDRLVQALAHRYDIGATLGEGGMATVYRARDLRHDRLVALKVLNPEPVEVVGADRFLAEIRTTANLQHPHILPLFDSGEAGGHLYYVMPYVEGESLRDRLRREHQLPVDEAAELAAKVAGALDHAHGQGVIHRDIKPGNILLSREGEPLVADFGIALALYARGDSRLTQTGFSLGTPHYMSPEQATGERSPGPATDIYALGCVLYEMLVGEPPFTGDTPQAVLRRIVTGEVGPVSTRRSAVPPNVDAAVDKALQKVPADRFRSAREFAEALRLPEFTGARRRADRSGTPRRWRTLAVAGSAAAVGALVPWWIAGPGDTPLRPPMHLRIQLPPGQELAGPGQLRLSSDASMLVYTGPGEDEGGWQLWAHDWSSGIGQPIPNTAGVPFFDPSPDNDEVALISEGSLRVQALESERTRILITDGAFCCVAWNEEDWIYYTDAERGVSRISPRGGEPEILVTADEGFENKWPSPVSGANLVVFERARPFGIGSRIILLDLDTGDSREVVQGSEPVPFGDLILFTTPGTRPDLRYVSRLARGAVATTIATTTAGGAFITGGAPFAAAAFDVSSAGHLVYSIEAQRTFSPLGTPVWVERDGTETRIDPTLVRPLHRVRLSPDGSRLVLHGFLRGVSTANFVKELPDGPLVRLTPEEEFNRNPWWAPDGSSIYYAALFPTDTDVTVETRRVRPDGAGEPENVGLPWPEATMTPDGEWWIYRTRNDIGDADLMAVRADLASKPIPLVATEAQEGQATVSRDGRWFAYSSDLSGIRQVYVRPFPAADSMRVPITSNGGVSPFFSPGTDELFVVEDGWMVTYSYATDPTFRVTARERLFDVSAYPRITEWTESHHYDVTRDARTFVMIRRLDDSADASSTIELRLDYLRELDGESRR